MNSINREEFYLKSGTTTSTVSGTKTNLRHKKLTNKQRLGAISASSPYVNQNGIVVFLKDMTKNTKNWMTSSDEVAVTFGKDRVAFQFIPVTSKIQFIKK